MYLAEFSKYASRGHANSRRMQRLGTTASGLPVWTEAETEICRSLHPDYNAMRKALPHRRRPALILLPSRDSKKMRVYTAKENSLFRKLYRSGSTEELRAAFPDVSPDALHVRGRYLGIARPKKPYLKTGWALLNALRDHCFRQGITMPELDKFAKAKRYFVNKNWRGQRGHCDYNAIVRGIQVLGGTISVTWSDQ